jgi:hypothetical protein
MNLFWAAIGVGVLLFLLAVGIPFVVAHRRLRPHEHVDADTYLDAKDQADENLIPERPSSSTRHAAVETKPVGVPRWAGRRRRHGARTPGA